MTNEGRPRLRRRARDGVLAGCAGLGLLCCAACADAVPPPTGLDREPPALLSAFFGLDDALPDRTWLVCSDGPGADGMPVVFSRRLLATSVDPAAFAVKLRSGVVRTPQCATTRPADDASENHTVLLMGDLGSASDPPVEVEIVGDLPLAGDANAKGLSVAVSSLEAGPTLVLALAYAPSEIETDCPSATRRVVVVVWAGGVTPGPGRDEEAHRQGYRVDGQTPIALGDLGDEDNYVQLCLAEEAVPAEVTFADGLLVDPRGDWNPATSVRVAPR